MHIKVNIDLKQFKVNKVIKHFIIADLTFFGGWGFIGPIFAVFIEEKIVGANLVTIGAASAIYWLVKSFVQIPVALFIDKHEGEKDDFIALIIGLTLAGFTALAFLLARTVPGLLFVALLQGISFGFYVPSWSAIFSRHLDEKHRAFDWSLDSTTIGIASGITAMLGGTIAQFFGFQTVFILASLLSFSSVLILLFVPSLIFPKTAVKTEPLIRDHIPTNISK